MADAPKADIVKTCACGAAYDVGAWRALQSVGVQELEGEEWELRRCAKCTSTITLSIARARAD